MRDSMVIVVYDPEDPRTFQSLTEAVGEYQLDVIPCASQEAVRGIVESHQPVDVVVLSLRKPFEDSFRLLAEIQEKSPQTEVIFVAEFDEEMLQLWMEVIQRGAYEFLPKPFDPQELKHHVVHATEKHHPVRLRKRPPAESVRELKTAQRKNVSSAGGSR